MPLPYVTGAGEVTHAWGHARDASSEVSSPDTLVGGLLFADGPTASVSISFAAAAVRFSLSVVGTEGSVEVRLAAG